jgi:uncharacterized protein (TIGR00251 family)
MHGRKNRSEAEPDATPPWPAWLTPHSDGITLAIKVQPRAAKNECAALVGPELRIKVTAPPVDAAANEALLGLLADVFNCPRNKVQLLRGHTTRHKIVKIHGLAAATAVSMLKRSAAS